MSRTTSHTNAYDRVTALIIAQLEQGTVPWHRPWQAGLPFNAITRHEYRGINILSVFAFQLERGLTSNAFVTYNQAQALGGWIEKGQRGCPIVYFARIERPMTNVDEEPDSYLLARTFTVFSLDQTGGLEALRERLADATPAFPPVEECDRVVERAGVPIQYGGAFAFYSPQHDVITLPHRHQFRNAEGFYSTVFHELTHATGAPHRLNRDLSGRWGDAAYSLEELVAELGSAFVAARCGLEHVSAAADYIDSWLAVLKRDRRALFTAARLASEAADYLWLGPASPESHLQESAATPSKYPDFTL